MSTPIQTQNGLTIYKRLLAYVKPYRWRLMIAILASQGFAIATGLISLTLYIIINGLQNRTEVVIDKIPYLPIDADIRFSVTWIPFIVVIVFSLRSIFEYISGYQMASVGIRAVRKIRDDLYDHLVHLSHDFYSKGRTGDFLSRIVNDVGSIQGAITDVISDLVKEPFVIFYNIPWVLFFGGKYALIALAVFPLVVIPISLLGRSIRRTTKKMQQRAADITSFIGETLAGIHIVKAFNCEDAENSRFQKINKSVFDYFKKMIKITLIQRPLVEVMGAVGAAVAIWFSLQVLPLDRFTAFVVSLFVFYEPIKKLSKVNSTIQQSIAAGTRIFEVFDAVPSIRDREGAYPFEGSFRELSFENVSFEYEPGVKVLNRIQLTVNRGEVFALVGPSGSGKTTMVNLIPRFYDPTEGVIRINGTDLRDLTVESLRGLIAVVSQDTVLFNMTVAENIAYGRCGATREEIKKAAEAAYADPFIQSLPQGYDTPLGERGMKLSGGQRQRIAIARALLKNAPILILDEATSHLDTSSERVVQTALENLMQGRTVFVIAHRLSTVQKADRILVLDDGNIVQQGTNESLLEAGGEYKKLHDLQFRL